MKIKLSNYVAQFLVEHGIDTVFTVTGGGAMHLNDGLGHQEGLHCVYQHHEQACAIAGEAYARMHNKIGAVCDHGTRRDQCHYRCGRRMAGFHPHAGDFWSGPL